MNSGVCFYKSLKVSGVRRSQIPWLAAVMTVVLNVAVSVSFAQSGTSPSIVTGPGTPPIPMAKRVKCGTGELSFVVLPTWTAVDIKQQGVVCAFKKATTGFPNANVIAENLPAGYANFTNERRTEEVIRSYKALGLTDAKVVSSESRTISGVPALILGIEYTSLNQKMSAVVGLFPILDRLFTVTLLDQNPSFGSKSPVALILLNSIEVNVPGFVPTKASKDDAKRSGVFWFLVGIAILVVAVIAWSFKSRKK